MLLSDLLSSSLSWQPESGDTLLLAGVESDLAVIETIVATLPAKARGRVFIEVDSADRIPAADAPRLEVPGRMCVTFLVRDRGQSLRAATDAWLAEMLPIEADREHRVYAWISGDDRAHAITTA